MRGLFIKIFIIFWIAQSLIFVISTALIIRHHFPDPGVSFDALSASQRHDAVEIVDRFEKGGCLAITSAAGRYGYSVALEDATGNGVCSAPGIPAGTVQPTTSDHINGAQVGQLFV